MTEQARYDLATVELVREHAGVHQVDAESILDALAEAGLLLLPGGERQDEWRVRWVVDDGDVLISSRFYSREDAEAYAERTQREGATVAHRFTYTSPLMPVKEATDG